MKKIFSAIIILSASSLLNSCTSNILSGNPKTTLISFFEALGKKDIEGARKLATADSKSMIDMIEMGIKSSENTSRMDKFDRTKMEFGDAAINGDNASVPVKEKGSGESVNFSLKKENGAWKVAFDMASLMQMGMQKMKETNPGGLDSLSRQMEELKKINIDSLKDIMKNGMQSLDSIKNVLKEKKTL